MGQSVKLRLGIKIWFCTFEILAIVIVLSLIFDKREFNSEKICTISLISLLAIFGLVYIFYLFSYKIIIRSEDFSVRKYFITTTFKIEDITGVEYKKAFGNYTYVVIIDKTKMEVSPLLNNKNLIDSFFETKGIFRKFPRVNY